MSQAFRMQGPHFRALFLSLVGLTLTLGGCATSGHVQDKYEEEILEQNRVRPSDRTVILFLIDGMSEQAVHAALARGDLPNLKRHFLSQPGARVRRAKTVFSSSTYPGIVSLLTASPVSRHGLISNRVRLNDTEFNFENVMVRSPLQELLSTSSVFARLGAQGYGSVSLSEPFRSGASVAYPRRLNDGLYYINHDYRGIDHQIIESLEKLLVRTPSRDWPAFIFVHLIGVDALTHQNGVDSRPARRYFHQLDKRLGKVLAMIREEEARGRKVVSLLTADHGFMERERVVKLENILKRQLPELEAIVEARAAQIFLPTQTSRSERAAILKKLVNLDGVSLAAVREENSLYVSSRGGADLHRVDFLKSNCGAFNYQLRLTELAGRSGAPRFLPNFACPADYDQLADLRTGAFAFASLADFFQASTSPDAVVVAGPGIAFTSGDRGNHGGLSQAEMIVPLLLRNAQIQDDGRLVSSPTLLEFLLKP